ncbi:hypothetical protein AURDEDRAFT_122520 [Auricularia subglabra TFB-10046 SS5]|nr:hypothetical protein AURDEDRAFT_122520 [Auricularia subglabra TFB-10046 SS5]
MRPSQESNARLNKEQYAVSASSPARKPSRHASHRWFIWIPLFAAFIWCGSLLAMLITWLAQGRPHYVSESPGQKVAYISDVGADILKPLFIVACSITAAGFVLSLVIERALRHSGRLYPDFRKREHACSVLSIIGALIGGAGLILLSIFDTKRHMVAHRWFLLVWVVGVAISAIFTVIEFRWIEKTYPKARYLRFTYIVKAVLVFLLVAGAIAFGATIDSRQNVAAIIEWAIAVGFTFYLLTFYLDLRPSKHTTNGELTREKLIEDGQVSAARI